MKSILVASLTVAGVLAAGPVLAQSMTTTSNDDWDITRDPSKKLVAAHIGLTSGLTIATRCLNDRFDVMLAGLPAAPGRDPTRSLALAWDEKPEKRSTWNATTDRTVAIADYPAATARKLREGGRLKVTIPNGAGPGRNLTHDVELPPSSAAIAETLTACGKPLEDPRDALLPDVPAGGLSAPAVWSRAPRVAYPNNPKYVTGYAVVTCVTQPDGSLADCVVESEHPMDGRFGEAVLQSTRRARVTIPDHEVGRFPPQMVGFRVTFMVH